MQKFGQIAIVMIAVVLIGWYSWKKYKQYNPDPVMPPPVTQPATK